MARIKTSINALETEDKQARRYRNNSSQRKHNNKKPKDNRDNVEYVEEYFKNLNIKLINTNNLNPRIMRKSAHYLHMVMIDFEKIVPRKLATAVFKNRPTTVMITTSEGDIYVNPAIFDKGNSVEDTVKHYNKDQQYDHNIANLNYTIVHEYGHFVNSKLITKAFQYKCEADQKENMINYDWNKDIFATALVVDCVQMLASTDHSIEKKLKKALGIGSGYPLSTYLEDLKSVEIKDINSYDKKREDLLGALYRCGFTSEYGTTNFGELYAEAFADYYWYEGKKYKAWFAETEYDTTISPLSDKLNPLSTLIVEKSQSLWNYEVEMDCFRVRHGYPTKQLQTTVNTNQQLQTTVKPQLQSLTSKGGLTK